MIKLNQPPVFSASPRLPIRSRSDPMRRLGGLPDSAVSRSPSMPPAESSGRSQRSRGSVGSESHGFGLRICHLGIGISGFGDSSFGI